MRTLLTFIGSVIYLFVMTIISPLLVLVYSGLELVQFIQYLKQQKGLFSIQLPEIRTSLLHFPLKRYFALLWAKAVRFHL